MNDTKAPAAVRYTTDAAGDGHAELPGNPHHLTWNHDTGNVTLDDKTRPMGWHLSEHAFHVQAEAFFRVPHDLTGVPAAVIAWREKAGVS